MKPVILFLDDEERVLKGLQRLLFRKKAEWEMKFCTQPEEVWALLDLQTVDVAVVDMRMPKMDGIAVLKRIRELQPQCIRIILSGQSSEEAKYESVDVAHQFLAKPCETDRVISTLSRALSLSELIADKALRELVASLGSLPSAPRIYQAFESLVKTDTCTCDEVSLLVSQDPALCAKLLQVVNTAFFGLPKEVISIPEAINYMGYEKLKSLLLVTELLQQVDPKILQRFDLDSIWLQGVKAQSIVKAIGSQIDIKSDELEMINAALMFQGIGELALAIQAPDVYQRVLDHSKAEHLNLIDAEKEVLGASHIQLSAFMLGIWGLPVALQTELLSLLEVHIPTEDINATLLKACALLTSSADWEVVSEEFTEAGFPPDWLPIAERSLHA